MMQQNPYMAAASRSGEPELNAARSARAFIRATECATKLGLYRLYLGDTPVGLIVECFPMEVHDWNKNARAFFSHQVTLGRDRLPILEYREELDQTTTTMFRITYLLNGVLTHRDFTAPTKAQAKREFNKIMPVTAVITTCETIASLKVPSIKHEQPEE